MWILLSKFPPKTSSCNALPRRFVTTRVKVSDHHAKLRVHTHVFALHCFGLGTPSLPAATGLPSAAPSSSKQASNTGEHGPPTTWFPNTGDFLLFSFTLRVMVYKCATSSRNEHGGRKREGKVCGGGDTNWNPDIWQQMWSEGLSYL